MLNNVVPVRREAPAVSPSPLRHTSSFINCFREEWVEEEADER